MNLEVGAGERAEGFFVGGGEGEEGVDGNLGEDLEVVELGEEAATDFFVLLLRLEDGAGGGGLGHEFDQGAGKEVVVFEEGMVGGDEAGGGGGFAVGREGGGVEPAGDGGSGNLVIW